MKSTQFEVSDYLDSPEMVIEYINTILEKGSANDVITALGQIAKSEGISKIASHSGLSRTSLYKALSENSHPQFETVLKIVRALGGKIEIHF